MKLTNWNTAEQLEAETVGEFRTTADGRLVARIYYPDGRVVERPVAADNPPPTPRFDTNATVAALRQIADSIPAPAQPVTWCKGEGCDCAC